MTFFIPGIATIPAFGIQPVRDMSGADRLTMPSAVGSPGRGEFGAILADKLGELDALHKTSDTLAVKAVTGDLTDIADYTIAANEATVATQFAVQVRNKAVDAFTEIMRMPL
ncbi:Flagellar hook-basal body complex protein FliE [Austwickia sp. TVS 96-490-7B]|uniref:flagellar hook-basal body complex protein FliE n=1 Tax=Austwickia sp. TVS 96-490-7B TaxID=2830843 RepID=UPI001DFFEB7E|nr:flagellar hook-basal body complex protein FliE [Austwickia sp. TVS 96-490-7B]MBW3083937.1 Flagellar hook-basal body complex protein FliE [Austwickia sp. TVS 96-490-7B]